jgi:hypothetical protein
VKSAIAVDDWADVSLWREQQSGVEFNEYDGYEWKLIREDVFRAPLHVDMLCW